MELNQWSLGEPKKEVINTNGYWIEYSNGEKHIDIQCGNAAYVLGYGDVDVINAMHKGQVNFLRGNTGETSQHNDELIKLICDRGNWAGAAYAVSGSDAVEAAIAMSDSYWEYHRINKKKIISFMPGYHGTTMLGKHLRGEYPYLGRASIVQAPMWKTPEQQVVAEENSLKIVRNILERDREIGCILMETIPWMADVTPYSINWWKTIRNLCDQYRVLMVVDDVAVCWGKNGTLFGWQPYGVQPDISALGKALTGGYSPLGVATCNKKVYDAISKRSWDHSHTWSPNMQGVYAALAVTKKLDALLPRSEYIGQQLLNIAQEFNLVTRGSGIFRCFDVPKQINLSDLSRVGLCAAILGQKSIKVVSPITADEEYFYIFKERFKKLL
ncbi:aminotransferase class III-fold pyridoxal phosphate-dependent enzyme [bacterium]|nr:aminotransferase class III-fold pyridoxal phosphate-dependent enzyme [bacterium]